MKTSTPNNLKNRGRIGQFYTILALVFVAVFTFTIVSGGFKNTLLQIRQLANVVSLDTTTYKPPVYSPAGTATTNIQPTAQVSADVYTTQTGTISPVVNNTNIIPSIPTTQAIAPLPPTSTNTNQITETKTTATQPIVLAQQSPSALGATNTTSNVTTQAPAPVNTNQIEPVQNTEEQFSLTKEYPLNLSIFPYIIKNGIKIYDKVSGVVSVHIEVPAEKAVILFGNSGGWIPNGSAYSASVLKRIPGTNRYYFDFDTRRYADGLYKIGSAYYDNRRGWVKTGVLDFEIKNAVDSVTLPSTSTTQVQATSGSATPITPTITTPSPIVKEKPILRLVVNDRQITDLKHSFDSEELELRSTSYPAQSAQFFAYAIDGAFKPALKEIGKGEKDELLSRDEKDVWTFTTDMRDFPTGNFKLFARVRYIDGTLGETQPISIVVEHLNQISNGTINNEVATNTYATSASRESILQRILSPSDCQNRQECEVFCSNTNSASEKCVNYVRSLGREDNTLTLDQIKKNQEEAIASVSNNISEILNRLDKNITVEQNASSNLNIISPEYSGRPSMADVVPVVLIEQILKLRDSLVPSIPEDVKTISDFQQYCGVVEHEVDCLSLIDKIAPELKNDVQKQTELVRVSEDKNRALLEQRSGARVYIDSDNDGITDFDEINFYNTDPTKKDTNGDGFSDGSSILAQISAVKGENATSSGIVLSNGVTVENPKITGSTQSTQFKITGVSAAETKDNDSGKKEVSKVALKGIALPNSFVKIFLFSEPIVVTVKTDDSGNWSYVLDKTLPDGTHTAYVAMADGGGRILAKSEPLPFVKEASAITMSDLANPNKTSNEKTFMGLSPMTIIALFIGVLGLALSIVGIVIGLRDKKGQNPDVTLTA